MSKTNPNLYEWMIISYNSDLSEEAVATFNTEVSDIYQKRGEVLTRLKDDGFNNVVYLKGHPVKSHQAGFEKYTINTSSRRQVYIYFFYLEIDSNSERSFCRITSIDEFDKNLLSNIEAIRKNLRWQFKRYEVKEYFDSKRLKFILKRHFS